MSENGTLKISYKEFGYPMELFIAAPLNSRADEYAALFNILRHYEKRKSSVIDLTATGVEQLRAQVAVLGITDITWQFV